jgi:polyferredoxin
MVRLAGPAAAALAPALRLDRAVSTDGSVQRFPLIGFTFRHLRTSIMFSGATFPTIGSTVLGSRTFACRGRCLVL